MKRKIERPWGRKRGRYGWIIQPTDLCNALKQGQIAEFGKIRVGARQLTELIKLMVFPDQELLITNNGRLEVQNIARVLVKNRTEFRKPRLVHSFRLDDKAWLPNKAAVAVVIKPRKFD